MNYEKVIKILNSIKNISSNNIKIITVGTSGTIKGLMNKHMSKINKLQKEKIYNHLK
jgi:RNase P/RNase MRP subunit POP5